MSVEHEVLFSEDVIAEAVNRLARSIDRDFDGSELLVVTVLKGAVIFSSDLVRAMRTPTELAYIRASSYEDGFTPGESLTVENEGALDVKGRAVLIVDDIVDTGRTLGELTAIISAQRPEAIATVALLSKTSRRSVDVPATYWGLEITDELVYGYGLDWNERFRHLPFIALGSP